MDPHDPYFEHPYDGRAIARVANPRPPAALAAEMQRLYRGEVEYLDQHFAQLTDNLAALAIEFTDAQIARLDAASRVELGFPHDMLDSPVAHGMFGGVTVAKPLR